MNHTEHYELPTWELSDRIMMKDFNDMTGKIDGALHQVKTTADGAKSSADESAKAVAEQGKQLTQCQGEIAVVKLAGPVENVNPGDITLSLSGADMSRYRALLVMVYGSGNANVAVSTGTGGTLANRVSTTGVGLAVFYRFQNSACYGSVHLVSSTEVTNTGGRPTDWSTINAVKITGSAYSAVVYGFKN